MGSQNNSLSVFGRGPKLPTIEEEVKGTSYEDAFKQVRSIPMVYNQQTGVASVRPSVFSTADASRNPNYGRKSKQVPFQITRGVKGYRSQQSAFDQRVDDSTVQAVNSGIEPGGVGYSSGAGPWRMQRAQASQGERLIYTPPTLNEVMSAKTGKDWASLSPQERREELKKLPVNTPVGSAFKRNTYSKDLVMPGVRPGVLFRYSDGSREIVDKDTGRIMAYSEPVDDNDDRKAGARGKSQKAPEKAPAKAAGSSQPSGGDLSAQQDQAVTKPPVAQAATPQPTPTAAASGTGGKEAPSRPPVAPANGSTTQTGVFSGGQPANTSTTTVVPKITGADRTEEKRRLRAHALETAKNRGKFVARAFGAFQDASQRDLDAARVTSLMGQIEDAERRKANPEYIKSLKDQVAEIELRRQGKVASR